MEEFKIYSLDITQVTDDEINLWYSQMSDEKKLEADRLQKADKRLSKIAADHLCRKAISQSCSIPCEDIVFRLNEKGKPFAVNAEIQFNVSHSGNMVVCAVSNKRIGIDIEKIRAVNPRAADKFATADEIDYIDSETNGFFEIWTLKEAYFKCIGTGLGADIKSVSFHIDENGITCSEQGFNCFFKEIADGYVCSVCIDD